MEPLLSIETLISAEHNDTEAAGRRPGLLGALEPQPNDPLLSLIAAFHRDPRPTKIDLGVGVYRDATLNTPVMRAVKAAEGILAATQTTKGYIGSEGDVGFLEQLRPIVFGDMAAADRLAGVQTPGGTGAVRLAADLIVATGRDARIWVGTPTWTNHAPIFTAARLGIENYRYFDVASQTIRFDEMMAAFGRARAGDVVLLHGCCHNPAGADLDPAQWRAVSDIVARRGLVPLVDLAYQGFGHGLDADAAGARMVLEAAGEGLIAYSCDKNFGLYRERTGALFALCARPGDRSLLLSNMLSLVRSNWSMPPDHGAAVARTVLTSRELRALWHGELDAMRDRIVAMRAQLAASAPDLGFIVGQHGMFSMLPLTPAQIGRLRDEHAIYMAGSGRINVAGLTPETVGRFADALASVR